MASEKVLKFVEDIKELSVLELAELVDAIQEEFGVTAAVAAAPTGGDNGANAAAEKTEFDGKSARRLRAKPSGGLYSVFPLVYDVILDHVNVFQLFI